MLLCICNQVREADAERYHLIGTNCGRCIGLIHYEQVKGNWRMKDLHYHQDGTGIEQKYSASEDRMYVRRYASNHDAIAEEVQKVRNSGGTKTKDDARIVASIPGEMLYAAEQGMTYGGRYKGILSADSETQQKLLASFMLEPEIKIFLTNDNYKV